MLVFSVTSGRRISDGTAGPVSKIWQALKAAELRREPAMADPPSSEGLSSAQRNAVRALLAHGNLGAAAEACGVSPGTLEGWLKTSDFVAANPVACRAARARR